MATTETYTPRIKERYESELRPALKDELGLKSVMQVPRITKITLNMGVGEAKNDAKQLDQAIEELTTIAGQRAQVRRARKSVAQFKIRGGMPIGAKVTLRGARMYEFLDRLVSIALPRIRELPRAQPRLVRWARELFARRPRADHFPEINYDDVKEVRGLDVTITTTAETDDHARALLLAIGLPFSGEGERRDSSGEDIARRQAEAFRQKYQVRNYTRCNRCGRPRAVFKKFGLCRICLRELAHQGAIPGK